MKTVENAPRTTQSENIPLTSIRGVAALWVLGSHAAGVAPEHWLTGLRQGLAAGFLGVDVFFVLSGFILAVVYRGLRPAGVPVFLLRRLARVYPLNLAIMAVIVVLAATVLDFGDWARWRELPWFVLMLQPYLPEPVLGWNVTTWSVGIELACYAVFPFALAATRSLPSAVLVALVPCAAVAACWAEARYAAYWWGTGALARGAAEFSLGMTLALTALRHPRLGTVAVATGEFAGLGGLVWAAAAGAWRFAPVSAGLLIIALSFDAGPVARILHKRILLWLGRVSFSVYLLHGLLLGQTGWVVWWLAAYLSWPVAMPLYFGLYLAVVLVLSGFTYRMIEVPGRRFADARAVPWLLGLTKRYPHFKLTLGKSAADDRGDGSPLAAAPIGCLLPGSPITEAQRQ